MKKTIHFTYVSSLYSDQLLNFFNLNKFDFLFFSANKSKFYSIINDLKLPFIASDICEDPGDYSNLQFISKDTIPSICNKQVSRICIFCSPEFLQSNTNDIFIKENSFTFDNDYKIQPWLGFGVPR